MSVAVEQAKAAIEREDYDSAIKLLRPLADGGLAEAEFLLGYLYFTSAEVSKTESRAWLERAAAQKHPEALYYLACLGSTCDFGPPEDATHRALLVSSAELGCPEAQRDLGCFHAVGDLGFPKDEVLARLWYGRAAAQGHADAMYNYGSMLLYGEGGPAEPETGMDWIRRAAAQGDHGAIHFLANS